MLGALRARRVPVALLVPGTPGTAGRARCSLEAAGLSGQLIAVVRVAQWCTVLHSVAQCCAVLRSGALQTC